jgi:hypothetical protein
VYETVEASFKTKKKLLMCLKQDCCNWKKKNKLLNKDKTDFTRCELVIEVKKSELTTFLKIELQTIESKSLTQICQQLWIEK